MLAASVASTAGGQTRICHDLKKARTCQLCNCSSSDESPLDYVGEEIFPEASGRVPWRSYDKARAQDGGSHIQLCFLLQNFGMRGQFFLWSKMIGAKMQPACGFSNVTSQKP